MSNYHQGHFARKRFGQNFLVDKYVVANIIAAINPQENDTIVEIGPGLGALTKPLLEILSGYKSDFLTKMFAIEIDNDLASRLQQQFGSMLSIINEDVLKVDFSNIKPITNRITNQKTPLDKLKIIGNLPYNISSPLLFYLLNFVEIIQDQYFMLQCEVADRITALPGTKLFGRLSILLQYYYHIEKLFNVAPDAFQPAPKVTSSVIRMIPRSKEEIEKCQVAHLSDIVTKAFSQRRKMLRNTLASYKDKIDFNALKIDLNMRAEDLTLENYVDMAQALGKLMR